MGVVYSLMALGGVTLCLTMMIVGIVIYYQAIPM